MKDGLSALGCVDESVDSMKQLTLFNKEWPEGAPRNLVLITQWQEVYDEIGDSRYRLLSSCVKWWFEPASWVHPCLALFSKSQVRRFLTDEQIERFSKPLSLLDVGVLRGPNNRRYIFR